MLQDFLSRWVEKAPEAPLLRHEGVWIRYDEMERSSNRIARLLRTHGIRKGDRVGLLFPNSPRYVSGYYGALKAGAIVVPLHAGSDERTLQRVLADCQARAVLAGPGSGGRLARASIHLPELELLVLPDEEVGTEVFPAHVRPIAESAMDAEPADALPSTAGIDLDRALIVYTSGSTGRPRGATLSHLNIVANTRSIVDYLRLSREDRMMAVLPFPYVYGMSLLNTHVMVGGSLVLHENMVFPQTLLDAMEQEAATGFAGVPSTFAILLNRSNLARRRFPALRYVTQAGGAMPVPHIRKLMDALPGVRIFVMYGATEASARLSYLDPSDLPRKVGSIGQAIPNVELTIRREDGTEADAGEVGEIVARGSNIMEGYWGNSEATREVLDDLGFHSGDLGYRDEDGFFWVTGRKREMIKSGAHRISPREIEEVLLEHPDIEESAVVGKPDEFLGEAIVAHVTIRPGSTPTAETIREFCRERLPLHKIPQSVVLHAALPRSPAGKIDKRALRGETEA